MILKFLLFSRLGPFYLGMTLRPPHTKVSFKMGFKMCQYSVNSCRSFAVLSKLVVDSNLSGGSNAVGISLVSFDEGINLVKLKT